MPSKPARLGVELALLPLLPWQAAHDAARVRMWGVLLRVSVEDKTSAAFAVMAKLTEVMTEVKNSAKNQILS